MPNNKKITDKWVEIEQPELNVWNPTDKDNVLIGLKAGNFQGNFGDQAIILTGDNEKIITPSHKVLQSLLEDIKKDTILKIEYIGEQEAKVKGRSPTKLYKVYLEN